MTEAYHPSYSPPPAHKLSKALAPYPTDLDVAAFIQDAISFFRGTGDMARITHDAWHAVGFGLGKLLPEKESERISIQFGGTQTFNSLSTTDAADHLERALANAPKGAAFTAGDTSWNLLFSLAIQAALRIINYNYGI